MWESFGHLTPHSTTLKLATSQPPREERGDDLVLWAES